MYVAFLAVSPWVLRVASRQGWAPVFLFGIGLWVFSQFDGGQAFYRPLRNALDLPGDYNQTGAFMLLSWQLLWLAGLWAGSRANRRATTKAPHGQDAGVVWTALAVASVLFAWRHIVGQTPFGSESPLNPLFDKWHLGPLRLLNFWALAVLALEGRGVLMAWARNSALACMGRASLAVFSTHLVLCLTLLAIVGSDAPSRSGMIDAAILAGSLVTLYAVARFALRESTSLRAGARPRAHARAAQAAGAAIPQTAR